MELPICHLAWITLYNLSKKANKFENKICPFAPTEETTTHYKQIEPHHKDEIARKNAAKNKARNKKKKTKKARTNKANI